MARWPDGQRPGGYYLDASGRVVRVHLPEVAARLDDDGRRAVDEVAACLRSWPRRDIATGNWHRLGDLLRRVWPALRRVPLEKLFADQRRVTSPRKSDEEPAR